MEYSTIVWCGVRGVCQCVRRVIGRMCGCVPEPCQGGGPDVCPGCARGKPGWATRAMRARGCNLGGVCNVRRAAVGERAAQTTLAHAGTATHALEHKWTEHVDRRGIDANSDQVGVSITENPHPHVCIVRVDL